MTKKKKKSNKSKSLSGSQVTRAQIQRERFTVVHGKSWILCPFFVSLKKKKILPSFPSLTENSAAFWIHLIQGLTVLHHQGAILYNSKSRWSQLSERNEGNPLARTPARATWSLGNGKGIAKKASSTSSSRFYLLCHSSQSYPCLYFFCAYENSAAGGFSCRR